MLELQNLSVRYPSPTGAAPAVHCLNLTLEDGGLLALLGPSGCGKTTLLHALAGVVPPASGQMLLDGARLSPGAVPTGLVPQGYGLLPWKTVRQNCLFTLKRPPLSGTLEALCARLGIGELLERYPGTLSGGQAQRAALARALLANPRLLLLDEPFAALDAAAAPEAQRLCLELWKRHRMTALAATHRIEEAVYLGTRIVVLGYGARVAGDHPNPYQGQADLHGSAALRDRLRDELHAAAGGSV